MQVNWTRHKLLAASLVLAACIAGGALECRRDPRTPAERRGAELYGQMCAVCHGQRGEGYQADEAPALGHPDFLATATDAFLRTAITDGRANTVMSPWAAANGGPLAPADVEALVAHLRTWQDRPPESLDEAPPRGDAERGRVLYPQHCARCHGVLGRTGPNVRIGNPELLASASDGFLRRAIRDGRPGTPMPAFKETLGEQGVEDLLALVRSFEKQPTHPERRPPPRPAPIPLGPVPLNPNGPEPIGFNLHPKPTSADVVNKQLERGARFALLDARAPSAYTHAHIAGAVSVPFYDPTPYFKKLPKDAWLVCYCACPHAESRTLAQKLVDAGFKKVTVLDEGLGYWRNKKYPTHSGSEPQ